MRIAFLVLALAITSVRMVCAHDGTEFVERNGPQFLFGWSDNQRDVAIEAVEALTRSPYMTNDVSADKTIHEQRQQRIIAKFYAGMPFYDQNWNLIQPFSLIAPDGSTWGIYQFSMLETMMLGFSTAWYSCDPTEQDASDDEAVKHCTYMMNQAKMLNDQINNSRHISPGGFNK